MASQSMHLRPQAAWWQGRLQASRGTMQIALGWFLLPRTLSCQLSLGRNKPLQ